jgi:hypothetical protein
MMRFRRHREPGHGRPGWLLAAAGPEGQRGPLRRRPRTEEPEGPADDHDDGADPADACALLGGPGHQLRLLPRLDGPGLPTNDYAADTKPAKQVARVMMQMATEINTKLAANIQKPADQLTRVQCMTCHRGAGIPVLPPPAPAPGAAPAAPAAPPAGR